MVFLSLSFLFGYIVGMTWIVASDTVRGKDTSSGTKLGAIELC